MIHKVFTIDISDDGVLDGRNDGTTVMTVKEAKCVMAFLLSNAKRISLLIQATTEDMLEVQGLADAMIDHSKEFLN